MDIYVKQEEELKKLNPKTAGQISDEYKNKNPLNIDRQETTNKDLTKYHPDNLAWVKEHTETAYLGRFHDGEYDSSGTIFEKMDKYLKASVDYNVKAEYYSRVNADAEGLSQYTSAHPYKSAYKRKKAAANAASSYRKADNKHKELVKKQDRYQRLKADENVRPKDLDKARNEALKAELDILKTREEAMLYSAKVKAFNGKDHNIRNFKVKLAIIAAKIAAYEQYNYSKGEDTAYGKSIKALKDQYKKTYLSLQTEKSGVKKDEIDPIGKDSKLLLHSTLFGRQKNAFIDSLSPGMKCLIAQRLIQGGKLSASDDLQKWLNRGEAPARLDYYIDNHESFKDCLDIAKDIQAHQKKVDDLDSDQLVKIAKNYVLSKNMLRNRKIYSLLHNYFMALNGNVPTEIIEGVIRPLFKQSPDLKLYDYLENPDTMKELSEDEKDNEKHKVIVPKINLVDNTKEEVEVDDTNPEIMKSHLLDLMIDEYKYIFNMTEDRAFWIKKPRKVSSNAEQQGWKMHINTESREDYLKALNILVPEFIAANIHFKIINSSLYSDANGSGTCGKQFTIYPDENMDWSKLSDKALSFLSGKGYVSHKAGSDKELTPRISTRYGSTWNYYLYNVKEGTIIADDRSEDQKSLDFVDHDSIKLNDIVNFDRRIKREFNEKHDLKAYLQQKYTGLKMSDEDIENGNYGFEILCFNNMKDADILLNNKNLVDAIKVKIPFADKKHCTMHYLYQFNMYFAMIPKALYDKEMKPEKVTLLSKETQKNILSGNFYFENIPDDFDIEKSLEKSSK